MTPEREAQMREMFRKWCESEQFFCLPNTLPYQQAERVWLACDRALEPKWLPIETAPKDGTLIDLWFGGEFKHRRSDCYWGLPHHCCGEMGSLCDSDWHGLSEGWVDGCFNEPISEFDGGPTHWMPLPEKPTAAMSAALEDGNATE